MKRVAWVLALAWICWWLQLGQGWLWRQARPPSSGPSIASLQAQVESLSQENERLRKLLDLPRQGWKLAVTARCLRRSSLQPWSDLWLDRGSADGLNTRCVALHSGGLVGRVVEVREHQCRVRPVTHPRARVPVQVAGLQGVVHGQGWQLVLEEIRARPALPAEALVTTSGLGEVYPGSILVGRVQRALPGRDPMLGRYELEPSVGLDEVLEVLLVEVL